MALPPTSSATLINYAGQLASPTGQPIPLPSFAENSIRFGERWAVLEVVTLHGQISGCTYNSLTTAKSQLEQIYSQDFQPLSIIQSGAVLYYSPYNRVVDLSFSESNYVGLLNYSVTLESYPEFLFSGYFGVLSPINEWTFQDTDNKLLEITHKVSARGINTSSGFSNAFQNAKNYVLGLTGSSSFINPYFASYCSGANLCILNYHENINRFDNVYSIEEKYTLDSYFGGYGYIRYTSNYECDINKGIASLSINGDVKSCQNADLATLRNRYNSFDVYSAAVQAYDDACGRIDLNPTYLSSGISEDNYNKKISFNIQFDNDFTPRTYFDYTTDVKIDENDITTVDVKGVIKSRGDLAARWINVQNYYNTQLNLFALANQTYLSFYNNNPIVPLNPIQLGYSVSKNQFIGEISVSTSYNNEPLLPAEFKDLSLTLNFKPAIEQIQSLPLVNLGSGSLTSNSFYYVVDLDFVNRAALSLNGHAIGSCTGTYSSMITGLKNLANSYILQYGTTKRIFLDKYQITSSNQFQGNDANFEIGWSFESDQPANITPFSSVQTLSLN